MHYHRYIYMNTKQTTATNKTKQTHHLPHTKSRFSITSSHTTKRGFSKRYFFLKIYFIEKTMEGLPSAERRTLRTSWIKYSDFLKSMERKRRLEEKLVSFCGYVIFIVSVCVTCALAVHVRIFQSAFILTFLQ